MPTEIELEQERLRKMYNPTPEPEEALRSDLWHEMSLSQLARQQEIAIDKVSKMHQILGPQAGPSVQAIYAALQMALKDLNALIDSRTKK